MRRSAGLEEIWRSGLFIGNRRANAYITVNNSWTLAADGTSASSVFRPWRAPFRHWAETGADIDMPRSVLKSISIDRSLDADCGQMSLVIRNLHPAGGPNIPGQGYFSVRQGSAQAMARWPGATPSPWGQFGPGSYGMFGAGSLIKTYQGWGGYNLSRTAAIAAGNVVMTGAWIVDDVNETDKGEMTISCRDVGQLLTDQNLYPPLLPKACYPTQFYSETWNTEVNEDPEGFPPTSTNYDDLIDICELIANWSGFHMPDRSGMMGLRENSGIDSPAVFKAEFFDKKACIDPIKEILKILGWRAWVNQEGGLHITSQNVYRAGNRNYDGGRIASAFDIDEKTTLMDLVSSWSKRADRTQVVVSQGNPALFDDWKQATFVTSPTAEGSHGNQLHGMTNSAFFALDRDIPLSEMVTMAELTGLRMWFARHRTQIKAVANPLIDCDDQVRCFEKTTWETYLSRVMGINTTYDEDTGVYVMAIDGQWMGPDNSGWEVTVGPDGNVVYN